MVGFISKNAGGSLTSSKNDIFKVEKKSTDDSKMELIINRQLSGEWFKKQFGKLR